MPGVFQEAPRLGLKCERYFKKDGKLPAPDGQPHGQPLHAQTNSPRLGAAARTVSDVPSPKFEQ